MITLNVLIPWMAFAGLAAGTLIFTRRVHRRQLELAKKLEHAGRAQRAAQARLADSLRLTMTRNTQLKARCARLDRRLLAIEARQKRLEQRDGDSRYELALQMAGHGAGVEQLLAAGLSRGEAELALRMHGLPAQ